MAVELWERPVTSLNLEGEDIFRPGESPVAQHRHGTVSLDRAEGLVAGKLLLFSHWPYCFDDVPDWHLDPVHKLSCVVDKHWTRTPSTPGIDIKCVWEASRFEWAPTLAQAWCASGDSRYIETLNRFSLSWLEDNPVNRGTNWQCGQETSIRLINLLLAWWLLGKFEGGVLPTVISAHLSRIHSSISYALSQDNNHGTSEAAGLFIGGAWLARYGDSQASIALGRKCKLKGRKWLHDRVKKLILNDGGFSQYSTNYHRVVLDTLSQVEFWRRELGEHEFEPHYYAQVNRAISWLVD